MQSPTLSVAQRGHIVTVKCEYWQVEHDAAKGGCWTSIRFAKGSRKNLLAGAAGSRVKFCRVRDSADEDAAEYPTFYERLDAKAKVTVEQAPDGGVTVLAEGTYADVSGQTIPVRFRRRYQYGQFGLVTVDLDILPEKPCPGVVEVGVMELALRAGMTDAYVREHPIPNPNADLRGGAKWTPLAEGKLAYRQKYVPLHVVCIEKNVEGIDLAVSSNLAEWDTQVCPDAGMGLYTVGQSAKGVTSVNFSPYCFAFRRVPITLERPAHFRMYVGLPFIKDRAKTGVPYFHCGAGSVWPSDKDLEQAAAAGMRLVRFHNDYREDGAFWHDGAYPPYDAAGMGELRRIIDTSHRLGMKIVPYMSLKEMHPDAPGYAESAEAWAQTPGAHHVKDIHTWFGTGEFGRLMCMKSPWLQRRKDDADRILSDLPWDGLYFDWTGPLPCRNPAHAGGAVHTDTDEYFDFLLYCRKRIGPQGLLFLHLSGLPYIVAENMADVTFIYEDISSSLPLPGQFPTQCDFIPIVGRYLAAGAAPGTPAARRFIMSSFLQAHPPGGLVPTGLAGFCDEVQAEAELFANEDLRTYRLSRASEKPIQTGKDNVFAALWDKPGRAIVYVGNCGDKPARGTLRFGESLRAFRRVRAGRGKGAASAGILCRALAPGKPPKESRVTPASLTRGLAYTLAPWQSVAIHLELK